KRWGVGVRPILYLRRVALFGGPQPAYRTFKQQLLSNYLKIQFYAPAVAEINSCLVGAEFLDLYSDADLFPVDLIALLLADGPADLQGGHAAEYFAAGTGFCPDFQGAFLQFGNHLVQLG